MVFVTIFNQVLKSYFFSSTAKSPIIAKRSGRHASA